VVTQRPTPIERQHTSGAMRNTTLKQSFQHAFAGLSHVLWTQKHVRTQLFMVVLVLLLAYAMKLDYIQVLFVFSAIAMVIMAELFNTAVEVVVNMITQTYHPFAKIAKDVAAAGVLIASFYSVIVAGGIFLNGGSIQKLFSGVVKYPKFAPADPHPMVVVLMCFVVLSIIVMLGKSKKSHGTILQGGAVSAHSAIAFMLSAAISIYSEFNILISTLALVLAILVAQSRVEGRIHSLREVILGAIIAILLMVLLVAVSALFAHNNHATTQMMKNMQATLPGFATTKYLHPTYL